MIGRDDQYGIEKVAAILDMIDNLSDIDGQTELAKTFNKSHVTDAQNQYDPNDESLGQK